jgi:hypothetical protein
MFLTGSRKIDYGSCAFHIWAESMNRPDQARGRMLTIRYCVLNVFTELDTPSLAPVAPVDSTL